MIQPLYKPLGGSTHQLAAAFGVQVGEKSTHTGTLDPMASGVVIALTGQDRFHKQQYADWKKIYRFSFLIGVSTDSQDLLGSVQTITSISTGPELQHTVETTLSQLTGTQKQTVPSFSARRINGESAFDKAKKGQTIDQKFETITIFALDLLDWSSVTAQDVQSYCHKTISQVTGEFRQDQALADWDQALDRQRFVLVTCQAVTSKRTYIRGLVRDIGIKLDLPTTTYSITRIQNGPYQVKDCICLI